MAGVGVGLEGSGGRSNKVWFCPSGFGAAKALWKHKVGCRTGLVLATQPGADACRLCGIW